jgi:tetratricopeptide (TPR) repeat protein
MNAFGADELIKKGIIFLRDNNTLGALACFEKAYSIEKNPIIQSYLGVCIAAERGQISEAVRLCGGAIEQDPGNPEHYLNLAKVYLKAKKTNECLDILRKGLSHGEHQEIRELLERVGVRKRPLFPMLPRGHVLNKYLGRLLRRLGLR